MEQREFFVCVYLKGGEPIAQTIAPTNDFAESIEEQRKKSPIAEDSGIDEKPFSGIFSDFCNAMLSYIEILPMVASIAPMLSHGIRSVGVVEFLKKLSKSSIETDTRIIYEVPERYYPDCRDMFESASKTSAAGNQIPKMLVIGIISTYEHHLSRLIRSLLLKNPGRITSSERQVTIREVFESQDISMFKENILEKEIDIILRNSFEEQIQWIESTTGIRKEIKSEYGDWPQLVEIFERRNLFTHNNGLVNDRYIRKAEKLKFPLYENLKKGQELLAGPKYLKTTLEIICEFGVKLSQVCWRKAEKGQSDEADDDLSDFSFDLIERGHYQLAIRMLEFFFSLEGRKNEERRLTCWVNLANAYKLNGDTRKSEKLLAKEDITVLNDTFRTCIAAVKGDDEEVVRLLRKMGTGCDFGERAYEDWPVFLHVRDSQKFKTAFQEVFGREYIPSPKKKRRLVDAIRAGKSDDAAQKSIG